MLVIITIIINHYSLFCMNQDWKSDAGTYYYLGRLLQASPVMGVTCHYHCGHWWRQLSAPAACWLTGQFPLGAGRLFAVGAGTGLSLHHQMLRIKTRQSIPESPHSVGTENSDPHPKEDMSWLIGAQITRPSQLMKACFLAHILVERDKRRGNKFVLKMYFNK